MSAPLVLTIFLASKEMQVIEVIEVIFKGVAVLCCLCVMVALLEISRFKWVGFKRRQAVSRRKQEVAEWDNINVRRTPILPKERLSLTTDKTVGVKLESIDEVIQADNEEYEYQLMVCSIAAQAAMSRERQAAKNKRPKLTIVK